MPNRYFTNANTNSNGRRRHPRHEIYHFYNQPGGPVFTTAPNMFFMNRELKSMLRIRGGRGRPPPIPLAQADYALIRNRLINLVGSGPRARTLVNNALHNRMTRGPFDPGHQGQIRYYAALQQALQHVPRVLRAEPTNAVRSRIHPELHAKLKSHRSKITKGGKPTPPSVINRIFELQSAILHPPPAPPRRVSPVPRRRVSGVQSASPRRRTTPLTRTRSASRTSSVAWVHRAPPGRVTETRFNYRRRAGARSASPHRRTTPRLNYRAPSFVPRSGLSARAPSFVPRSYFIQSKL